MSSPIQVNTVSTSTQVTEDIITEERTIRSDGPLQDNNVSSTIPFCERESIALVERLLEDE